MDKESVVCIHTYTMKYYSFIKNNGTWMDFMACCYDRERQILYDLIYMWNLKTKTKLGHRYGEQIGGCQKWGWRMGKMTKMFLW